MDLGTKLKNTKTQRITRIISLLLSFVFVTVGLLNGVEAIKAYNVFGSNFLKSEISEFETETFRDNFSKDVTNLIAWSNRDFKQKQIETAKARCIDGMLKNYITTKTYYDENAQDLAKSYKDYNDDNYDGYDGDVDYEDASSLYSIEHDYDEFGKDEFYYQGKFRYPFSNDYNLVVEFNIPLTYSEEKALTYIEKKFDNEVNSKFASYLKQPQIPSVLDFYIESNDGVVFTNVDDVNALKNSVNDSNGFFLNEKNIGLNKFYVMCGELNDAFYIGNTKQAYFKVDMSKASGDSYATALEEYNSVSHSVRQNVGASLICILLLIALLIINCTLAGRKGAVYALQGIDKVPNDLHFIVSGALALSGVLLVAFFSAYRSESFFNSNLDYADLFTTKWCLVFICALACAVFVVFNEWLTSVARQSKMHSGFFKNTLIYKLTRLIVKLIKKCVSFLKYRPEIFKKQLIAFLAAYGVVNALLLFFVSICDWGIFRLLLALVWFGTNAASLVFIAKYVMDLDEIIKAFNERRPPRVNYQKLPQSLKQLVNAQRYTTDELNRAVEKAVKDERMRSELITNVSHDLKTPLTSIITYVDLLKHCDIEDEKAQEYITVLDEKGGRLKRLIDDLVEASKITSGVVKLNLVKLDLGELATQAVVEHQQEFADSGLELIFKGDKKSLTAVADGQKTYRVIENLMSNARKYSAKGSRVYADVYEQNNTSVFEIKNVSAEPLDISADELKERFVRGDKSRNKESNGLGLSIADNLCRAMHGRMEIHIDGDLFKVKVVLPRQ